MTKYCRTCGTKMKKAIQPVGLFDEDTGKREVIMKFSCPHERFWRWGHYAFAVNTNSHLRSSLDPEED